MDTDVDRARWRFNAAYSLSPRFKAGIEFNPAAGEVLPTANWLLAPESERAPAVSLGFSSDRIFTPPGYVALYATASKSFPEVGLAPYVGLSYSGFEQRLLVPFGLNWSPHPEWDLLAMHDGRNTHALLTRKFETWSVTLMAVRLDRFGVSVGWSF